MRKFFAGLILGLCVGYGGHELAAYYTNTKRLPAHTATETQSTPKRATVVWAEKIEAVEGVDNFHQVSATLFRSAQPTDTGMENLNARGIRTIVNLRSMHSDRDEIGSLPLAYEHIKTVATGISEDDVMRFLKIATDKSSQPLLVHCKHGSDRTGLMCAYYRVVVDGWSKDDAIKEMTRGGFGFHEIWRATLIPDFMDADTDGMREQLSAAH